MKQIAQNYKSGELSVLDVPTPVCRPGGVLVQSLFSLISTGTEMMKLAEAKMSMVGKARARPDQVRKVLDTVSQQGAVATYKKVMNRLDSYTPLGYSLCGVVVEVGPGAEEFRVGHLVAAAGNEYALHAEYNWVPSNLCAAVPKGRPARARRLLHRGRHRHARGAPGRGPARRHRLRHRPRPGRPAGGPAAGRLRGPGHRPGRARGALPGGREGRRRPVRRAHRRGHRRGPAGAGRDIGRPRRRPPVPGRGRVVQRAGRGRRPAGPGPGARRRHRQDAPGPAVERLLRQGTRRQVLPVLRSRALRRPLRARRHRLPGRLRAVDRAAQPGVLPRPHRAQGDRGGNPHLRPVPAGAGVHRLRRHGLGLGERGGRAARVPRARRRKTARGRPAGSSRVRRPPPAAAARGGWRSASSAPATTPPRCCCRTWPSRTTPTCRTSRPRGPCRRSTPSAGSGSRPRPRPRTRCSTTNRWTPSSS